MENKDLEGKGQHIKGKIQEKYGDLTGDPEAKSKGIGNQISGSLKQGVEDLKEKARDILNRDESKKNP